MIVNGKPYQSLWPDPNEPGTIRYINQNLLPFEFRVESMRSSGEVLEAICSMKVRGAPLIGVSGAFGIYLACLEAETRGREHLILQAELIRKARPTAVNLAWAVDRMMGKIKGISDPGIMALKAMEEAVKIMKEDIAACHSIGKKGLGIIKQLSEQKGNETVNILTHCNAGWLACVDYGTATAPVYLAHDEGIPVHIWVDETRPRNQGARLTAWELSQHGVPHTVIVDNAGGHLMQNGMVDMVLVGSDRTTRTGDVANKIGTYLKALAARDNNIPFYAAMPTSTIDMSLRSGIREIEIEERVDTEVRFIEGLTSEGTVKVEAISPESPVSNFGFDVTPAVLVTGLITEKGICRADENEIQKLFDK